MPDMKNQPTVDERTASVDKTKSSRETIQQVFYQTSINDQRPKVKIKINGIVIKGLVDTGTDVTII